MANTNSHAVSQSALRISVDFIPEVHGVIPEVHGIIHEVHGEIKNKVE